MDTPPSRLPIWLRRARNVSAILLFALPVILSAWDISGWPGYHLMYVEVPPPHRVGDEVQRRAVERVAQYQRERPSELDRLLPEGRGGTRYFLSLDDKAGLAFLGPAIVGLSAEFLLAATPGAVEVHERGHLVDYTYPAEVSRLLARVPPPAVGTIAAENAGQHFAEMPAEAWELVRSLVTMPPPDVLYCAIPPDPEWLERVEQRVPGTAGFVVRFFDTLPPLPEFVTEAAELRDLAARLSGPYAQEMDALWARIESHRRSDGTFRPLPAASSLHRHLHAQHARLWRSPDMRDKVVSLTVLPGLAVTTLLGV